MKPGWAAVAWLFAACVQAQVPPELASRAHDGDAQAQAQLGEKYLLGDGVPEDWAEAWKGFNLSAAQGDALAEFRVAQLSVHLVRTQDAKIPHDPDRDYEAEAHTWYAKAAAQNYAPAEFSLASSSVGATEFDWYLRAAQHDYRPALTIVALAYADGRGTPRDYAAALKRYEIAAAHGDASAALAISALYRNGLGVRKDAAEAKRWLRRAAGAGNPSAIAWLRAQQHAPLSACAPAPKELTLIEHTSTGVLYAAPDDKRQPEPLLRKDGNASPFSDFRLQAADLTITLRQHLGRRAATDAGDGLVAYGGGDARITTESSSHAGGAMSVEWQDVGRAHSTVALRIEYPHGGAAAACAVIRSARLLDTVADLSVARIDAASCAMLRNLSGVERRVCKGEIVTRDFGRIVAITPAGVELPDGRGNWKESAITLPLQR